MRKFRAIVYIDGFNFQNGIKRMYKNKPLYANLSWREALWLDPVKFSSSILSPNEELVAVKYFTSRFSITDKEYANHNNYLDVLHTLENLEIIEGKFKNKSITCGMCKQSFEISNEKQTDVNFATELTIDTIKNKFDNAILITVDSDYIAPIKFIREQYKTKRLIIHIPETNYCVELSKNAHRVININREQLLSNQLPDAITLKNGYSVRRPEKWK